MVYQHHVSLIQPPADEDDPTIEEQIIEFEESIGQCISSETKANELFRASLIARGIDPDAKAEISPELAARMEEDAMKSDKDIFFGDMNREFRGKKITPKDNDFE